MYFENPNSPNLPLMQEPFSESFAKLSQRCSMYKVIFVTFFIISNFKKHQLESGKKFTCDIRN